jgi:ATP-dependent RNA helicase SUPV3L1/SUV3
VSVEAAAPDQAETASPAAAEPGMIEVWRPGRPPGERRPRDGERRGRRRQHERPAAQAESPPAGEAAVATAEPAVGASGTTEATPSPEPARRGRPRHRRRDGAEGEKTERRADRPERRNRSDRPDRSERRDRPQRRDRERRDDNRPSRTWSSSQEPRGKEPDPNSPFAKLLALKAQLEANKEQQ